MTVTPKWVFLIKFNNSVCGWVCTHTLTPHNKPRSFASPRNPASQFLWHGLRESRADWRVDTRVGRVASLPGFSVGTKRAIFHADGKLPNSEDGWREFSERIWPWWSWPLQLSLQAYYIQNTIHCCKPANSLPVDTEQHSRRRDLQQHHCKNPNLTLLRWISWLQIPPGSSSRWTKVIQPLSSNVTYSRSLDTVFQNLMVKTKPTAQNREVNIT